MNLQEWKWPPCFTGGAIIDVPSCGKYEVEWALRHIMINPGCDKLKLIEITAENFHDSRSLATDYVLAAWEKFCELKKFNDNHETDQERVRKAFDAKPCDKCGGEGGFLDTTYDRTGAWELCKECIGYGETFDQRAVAKTLGFKCPPEKK